MTTLLLLIEALLWLVDLTAIGADLHAWFKGKENRTERKESRQVGGTPPPRDRWNRRVIILTSVATILAIGLICWRLAQ